MGVRIYRPDDMILSIGGPRIIAARGGAGNDLLNALIAFWPGDELSGNLLDAHTNGLHLTDMNTVTSNPGHVYPTARQYTAANSERHTRPGDDALLSAGDVDFTLAAWVYLDDKVAYRAIAGQMGYAGARSYLLIYRNDVDRMTFWISPDGTANTLLDAATFGSPPVATWFLCMVWHDSVANTINISVNDGAADTAAHAAGVFDAAYPFQIGCYGISATRMNGRIGPTALWKSAPGGGGVLTAEQRTALWDAGAGLKYEDLTA